MWHGVERRHMFMVLHYVRRHNEMVDEGDTEHILPFAATKGLKKKHSTNYACTKKKAMKNTKKAMKKILKK